MTEYSCQHEFNEDWLTSSCTLPKLDSYLQTERKRHREMCANLFKKAQDRQEQETNKRISQLDSDINLKQLLSMNQKYLSIGRNKPTACFFGPIVMNRILHDVAKLKTFTGENRNKATCIDPAKYINHIGHSCARYMRHLKRFENREYYHVIQLFDKHADSKSMSDGFIDTATSLPVPLAKNNEHIDISLPNLMFEQESQRIQSNENKSSDTLLTMRAAPVIQPRRQSISKQKLKLPLLTDRRS